MNVTAQLAEFAAHLPADSITDRARDETRRSFIDTIGTMLAGVPEPPSRIMREYVINQGAAGSAWVAGSHRTTTPMLAALANGTAAHALDFDDGLLWGHPGVAVVPIALAVAEETGADGRRLLDAIAVGYEIGFRVGMSTTGEPYRRGLHGTSIYGVFAATAACGRLVGLSVDQMRHAFGIAGSLAAGVRANFGTHTKPLHAGQCGRHGGEAAYLAAAGFTADPNIIEAKLGFGDALLGHAEYNPEKMVQGLGNQPLAIEGGVTIKKYPCCLCNHVTLDGMFSILERRPLRPEDVEWIAVEGSPMLEDPLIYVHPDDGLQAKFSLRYSVALALVDGRASLAAYSDERAHDPQIHALIDKVEIRTRPDLTGYLDSKIEIGLTSGEVVSEERHYLRGHMQHPLTWVEVLDKYRDTASVALKPSAVAASIKLVERLEGLADVRELTTTLAAGSRPPTCGGDGGD
jgi:2-methylcitrate dehydratase PrpD